MTITTDHCRRAGFGLLVLCTVWLVIENAVLLALLAWTQLAHAPIPTWLCALAAIVAAPIAWLAAVATFALARHRRSHRGPWAHRPEEVPNA